MNNTMVTNVASSPELEGKIKRFHTRESLLSQYMYWERGKDLPQYLEETIFGILTRIRGVQSVTTSGYETTIRIGATFDWEEDRITGQILEVLSIFNEQSLSGLKEN